MKFSFALVFIELSFPVYQQKKRKSKEADLKTHFSRVNFDFIRFES